MARFRIYNIDTGEDFGVYEGENENAALDAMARAFQFKDYADTVAEYGVSVEDAKAELQVTRVPDDTPLEIILS